MAAISRTTGNIYISDGYGNFRVHKYSPAGDFIKSWGEPGIDPGQFLRPHNIAVDADDRVYVADREAHRVQVRQLGFYLYQAVLVHRQNLVANSSH